LLTQPECLPCIIDDLWGAIKSEIPGKSTQWEIWQQALRWLADQSLSQKVPSYYITGVHRLLKRISGISFPFQERRNKANRLGQELASLVENESRGRDGFSRFSFLLRIAVAANSLDFRTVGLGYESPLQELKRNLLQSAQELAVDETRGIYSRCQQASRILYIHDNVGEIALDKLLIGALKAEGKEVVSAVKGGPITSDVILEDAKVVSLEEVSEKIIVAGPDTLGISFEEISEEMVREISSVQLIIAKGQANFYIFSEYHSRVSSPVACLFRTKCDIVSQLFRKKGTVNIAYLLTK